MRALLALFVRALRQNTRAPSTYLFRGGIALIVLFFLWSAHESLSWMGAGGLRFFSILIGANYFFVALLGLGTFASAIAEEKEEGTLGLMRMANLSPLAILFGKSTSRLGIVLLLLLAELPFTFLAVTLGGVSQSQILAAFALLATFLFVLANVSLFFSVLLPRSSRAAIMTVALAIGYCLLCAAPFVIAERLVQKYSYAETDPMVTALQSAGEWLWSVHPAKHFGILASGGYLALELTRSVIVHLSVGIAFFILSILFFERCCGNEAAYSGDGGRRTRRLRWLGRSKRAFTQAVAWKDFHFAMGGRPSAVFRFAFYVVWVAVMAWVTQEWNQRKSLADMTWSFGLMMWHVELVILALLMWGPEAWGKHIGTLIATPQALRRINFEKLKAMCMATAPSIMLLLVAMGIGGAEFIRDTVIGPFQYTGLAGGVSVRNRHVIDIALWLIQFGGLLTLVVNLSLRLKWTAVPVALGLFGLVQAILAMVSVYVFYFRGLGGVRTDWLLFRDITVFVIFLAIILFLLRNTHKLLLRRAAEG
jgi:ABC-type transport system involved in multi-copper enzyme maturation permease subunit